MGEQCVELEENKQWIITQHEKGTVQTQTQTKGRLKRPISW